ncbi:MAG: AbrB/MazE/SpoVT family DNA-binding domain-containing protein [Terracidiphilus sp.]|jgi:putative addiction module antidote
MAFRPGHLRRLIVLFNLQSSFLSVIPIGNSAGIILPKETLARLNVQKDDTLYITESAQGIRLMPYDQEFATQMEAAREIMRENRDVLQRLAE